MTVLSGAMGESQDPDFALALRLMEQQVHPASERMSSLRGDASAAWKRIEEDARCNRQAAKVFDSKVRKASDENAADFIRTFVGLCRASGHMDKLNDLVTRMEAAPAETDEAAEGEDATEPAAPVPVAAGGKPRKAADPRPPLH